MTSEAPVPTQSTTFAPTRDASPTPAEPSPTATPPVLSEERRVLGGVTDRELVLRALHSLPEEKIVGVVLNDRKTVVVDAPSLASMRSDGDF